jgi:dTDP-glucose pyrophosphorylase
MILLMPMAGEGKRFREAGFDTPKPFIQLNGKPMFLNAVECLPKADRHVFIAAREIPGNLLPVGSETIYVNNTTAGQASTCLLAKSLIDNEEPLLIAACDNGLQFSMNSFAALAKEADCIVFTFRHHPAVLPHPEQYGWVNVQGNEVLSVSCKKQLGDDPFNDHAITGAFWFAHGKYFVKAAEKMISENRKVNNEFYVDECINDVLAAKLRVKVLEVDKYICWGTPNDLKTYLYWQNYYSTPTPGNA